MVWWPQESEELPRIIWGQITAHTLILTRKPALEHCYKTPHHILPGWDTQCLRAWTVVSLFALQSNKAVLWYSTRNSLRFSLALAHKRHVLGIKTEMLYSFLNFHFLLVDLPFFIRSHICVRSNSCYVYHVPIVLISGSILLTETGWYRPNFIKSLLIKPWNGSIIYFIDSTINLRVMINVFI